MITCFEIYRISKIVKVISESYREIDDPHHLVIFTIRRSMAATFSLNKTGLGHFAARLLLLPFLVALMSILYSHSSPVQSRIFLQTGGLIFNVLTLFYATGIAVTSLLCKSKDRLIQK